MKEVNIYAEVLEDTAKEQFDSAMEQDFSIKGALMADAHAGYSLPIGGVVATEGVIVPAWVGYDIGCGMTGLKTTFNKEEVKINAKGIFDQIYKVIPVGFNVNNDRNIVDLGELDVADLSMLGQHAYESRRGLHGLGTLGGGNHFIEIGYDNDDAVWIIIHSGSRGVGHGIATEFMRLASGDGKVREGHYALRVDTTGRDYINDMNWALKFALKNRKAMVTRVVDAINYMGVEGYGVWDELINRNHNHAEERDGLWIHRKGATHAEEGMMGVIPGNMRDGSFVVRGKGNPNSLFSSSHGAGRVLGRRKAKDTLDVGKFVKTMEGITAKVGDSTLDESPFAYKNIFDVMAAQTDLVDVVTHVKPLINIKG